jgi:uncharacterized OB-fold protein
MSDKPKVPAVEGWFTMDEASPHLIGSQCSKCKSYYFPKQSLFCRNPECDSEEFDEVELSNRGKIWSYTNNCYKPPAPYIQVADPFEPFALAGVQLEKEGMIILGMLSDGVTVEDVKVGQEAELVLGTLFEDEECEKLVWKWKPIAG